MGRAYYNESARFYFKRSEVSKPDSIKIEKLLAEGNVTLDSMFSKLSDMKKQSAVRMAVSNAQSCATDLEMLPIPRPCSFIMAYKQLIYSIL